MYVQWLLEFVWRIFIQGPLLIINFFTTNGNINNLLSNIGFTLNTSETLTSVINITIVISIIMSIFAALFVIIFVFKIFKVLIVSNNENTKMEIIELSKEFLKTLCFIFIFTLFFSFIFILFDVLFQVMNEVGENLMNNLGSSGENITIENIPSRLYWILTGLELGNNTNFLPPSNDFLSTANSMNFLFSIILVVSFSFILIWIVWSMFQKMIEIVFLYITFPISLAAGIETQQISWKIWMKEIINKIVLVFILAILLRVFLYLFYFICETIIVPIWSDHNNVLYVCLFLTLALGGSSLFVSKMFSIKTKENIGIFSSIKSFKQTRNFIINNKLNSLNGVSKQINLEPINANVKSLRIDLSRLSNNLVDYKSLRKVKVFNK